MAKLIGTDKSIAECRKSGYAVIDSTGLMKDGKLDKNHLVHLTISDPENWTDNGKPKRGLDRNDLYVVDKYVSFRELWELFEEQGKGIKSYCDFENCPFNHEDPSEYDLLHLAQTLSQYCGL